MTMTTTTHRPGVARPAALPTLGIGLAASGLVTAATLLDQLLFGSLEAPLEQVYAPYNVARQGARTLPFTGLLILGVAGMAGWLLTIRAAIRRPTWAALLGTALVLLGLAVALTLLTAREYGQTLVPTWLGLLNLLPPAIGLIATARLWRPRSTNRVDSSFAGR
jgi:hypothetical protein